MNNQIYQELRSLSSQQFRDEDESDRLNGMSFALRFSDEARARVRQAFEQAQIAMQCMTPGLLEQFEQAARQIPESFSQVTLSRFSIAHPRYGKQQQIDYLKWCAFPPGGVMPLRLRDVMRSPSAN